MKKKIFFLLLISLTFTAFLVSAEEEITINFFYSTTCPHCAAEKKFLEETFKNNSEVVLKKHLVTSKEGMELLKKLYSEYDVSEKEKGLVPATFIEGKYFVGYRGDEETGGEIEEHVLNLLEGKETDSNSNDVLREIKIPVIGKMKIEGLAPLPLSIVLGTLDGFNACAMVALSFLLASLAATGVRKKIILIGGVFIFISGLVYFLFIAAWLNLFLVLEQMKIITAAVGGVIIIFSLLLLKEYINGVVCKICNVEEDNGIFQIFSKAEKKLFEKMKELINKDLSLPLLVLGVSIIAAGVNLVELACSLGFPLAFTRILTTMNLPGLSYYFYIFLYVLFYMIDDFIIFLIVVFTLKITKISDKYLQIVKLIASLVLLVLGIIFILQPSLLTSLS